MSTHKPLAALAFAFGGNGVYTVDALLGITIGSQPAVVWGILIVAVLGAFGNVAARRAPAAGGQPSAS